MEGNNLKIRPLFDNVLVRKDEIEEKSKTGIIITGSDDQPALVGTVLSVGKEVEEEIKPGDKIMYAPFSGRELGGFLLLAQHDIMGVIEETKKKKGNCVCTAACGAGLGHNIEEVEIECVTCGTYGKVKNYGGRDKNIFNEICPNCSSGEFKRRK